MTRLFISLLFLLPVSSYAQDANEQAIYKILALQSDAWNRGDMDAFMTSYWHSDSLMFIGKKGVTYGWQNTMDNYKKSYPSKESMGTLTFTVLQLQRLCNQFYIITGKWYLQRTADKLGGHFTLLFQKIQGRWVIVKDHTS